MEGWLLTTYAGPSTAPGSLPVAACQGLHENCLYNQNPPTLCWGLDRQQRSGVLAAEFGSSDLFINNVLCCVVSVIALKQQCLRKIILNNAKGRMA